MSVQDPEVGGETRVALFTGTTTLAGQPEEPVEALVGRYHLADAQDEVAAGAELVVWMRRQPSGPRFAGVAAVEGDGEAHGGDLTSGELLTKILVEPSGPEATAFRASKEAATLAGPPQQERREA